MRCVVHVVMALLASCGPRPTAQQAPIGNSAQPAVRDAAVGAPPAPSSTTTRAGNGGCDPQPHEGDPCGGDDSWCVLSWGEPGGRSSALWCRRGRWVYEEEDNVP